MKKSGLVVVLIFIALAAIWIWWQILVIKVKAFFAGLVIGGILLTVIALWILFKIFSSKED